MAKDATQTESGSDLGRYRLVRVIAGKGTGPGQFRDALRAVTLDDAGLIYAIGDSGVKVFSRYSRRWG